MTYRIFKKQSFTGKIVINVTRESIMAIVITTFVLLGVLKLFGLTGLLIFISCIVAYEIVWGGGYDDVD